MAADHSEALVAQAGPREGAVGLHTRNATIVTVAAEYVKHDIYLLEMDRRLAERGISLDRELAHLQAMGLRPRRCATTPWRRSWCWRV